MRDALLEEQMELATRAVVRGRSLRSKHDLKIRQPLRRLYLLPPHEHSSSELAQMTELLADELNIKEVVLVEDETELSEVSYKPNFRALGPRFGKRMKDVAARVAALTAALRRPMTLPMNSQALLSDVGNVPPRRCFLARRLTRLFVKESVTRPSLIHI